MKTKYMVSAKWIFGVQRKWVGGLGGAQDVVLS